MTVESNVLREEPPGRHWAGKMHGGKPGDRRAGVVWHTQGSGKSFTMLFFAARVIREPAMQNPTLVVLTDRNDLDDQLFGQFQRCADILGQTPGQAASRSRWRGWGHSDEENQNLQPQYLGDESRPRVKRPARASVSRPLGSWS
jgi:hypothetical protein